MLSASLNKTFLSLSLPNDRGLVLGPGFSVDRLDTVKLGHSVYDGLEGRKEGNVLFNDALNTFYLRLYGVGHMVKDHSDSERENTLPPHGLLFPINSKGSFICTIL